MFASAVTMLLIGVGAAMDYSNMASKRSELQSIADAVVIAAVTSGYDTEDELKIYSKQFLTELGYPNTSLDITLTSDKTVIATPKAGYEMLVMGAFGHESRDISATAEAPLPGGLKTNLALVLDTTRSMEGERMTALKSAADTLLKELETANNDGEENIQVSLVPFADYVRIAESKENENWLDRQPDQIMTYEILDEENSTNCRQVGEGEEAYTECDTYVYEERTRLAEWKGCMASRPNGHHIRPEFFGAHRLQGFVAHSSCNGTFNELEPLSYDLPAINASVQALKTKSQTYIPAGLIWGWRTLDNRAPFTQNVATENVDTQNVMLLMTDGSNSVSLRGTKPGFDGIYHWGESDNPEKAKQDADLLTSELCSSIKDDGIKIISVAFEIEEESTKTLLENCATSPSDYYDATNSAELKRAFKNIGSGLNEIRLIR